jgi:Flp pilus assembly protein TadB
MRVRTLDLTLLLVGAVVLVLILTTHYQSLWLASLALAARAGVAVWALLKRRRAAAT